MAPTSWHLTAPQIGIDARTLIEELLVSFRRIDFLLFELSTRLSFFCSSTVYFVTSRLYWSNTAMADEISEKHGAAAPQVTEQATPEVARPESSEPDNEKPEGPMTSVEDADEPVPHLHAKTFLVVFAVCLIYFVQLINVVGAGAVRRLLYRTRNSSNRLTASPRYCRRTWRRLENCVVDFRSLDILHCSQPDRIPSSRLLGQKMVPSNSHCIWRCRLNHHCPGYFDEHGDRR